MSDYYKRLKAHRQDDKILADCIGNVVKKLDEVSTSSERPGMLLGKIQSGKTRAFVGVIAAAFDDGYNAAIVLTKGTKSLSSQTVARLRSDFGAFIEEDDFMVIDIMKLPERLTKNELRRKLIFVAKKQIHNIQRLTTLFEASDSLKNGKILLVDDEADLAGIRFTTNRATQDTEQGKIAQAIDLLRHKIKKLAVLQVTATPYSLYLQPEEYAPTNQNSFTFKPKRPAFTELLPIHKQYVGGNDYFGVFTDKDPRSRLFVPVTDAELDALRREDQRRISEARVMDTDNTKGLRRAILTFMLAVVVRRWQAKKLGLKAKKFAMVIHNDTAKSAQAWQKRIVEWIFNAIVEQTVSNPAKLAAFVHDAYEDLSLSIQGGGYEMPSEKVAATLLAEAVDGEDFRLETVNSDNDVAALLDVNSELELRTPGNIFIGGNILDRGITIPNLISFYYGRNPRVMQADTVLQHSRMYGSRPPDDLAVTRFYTSLAVYDRLLKINSFENALRDAFEKGAHDQGVVFIETDAGQMVRPCAPNKILLSDVVTISPTEFLLPTEFDTLRSAKATAAQKAVSSFIQKTCPMDGKFYDVSRNEAVEMLDKIAETLDFDLVPFDWDIFKSALAYYVNEGASKNDKISLIKYSGRQLDKGKSWGRTGVSILGTPAARNTVLNTIRHKPAIVLLEQSGTSELHWKADRPFWWPMLAPPPNSKPVVFASKTR
jgi:hypothetical protein